MGLSRLEEIGFKIFSDFIEVSYAFTDLLDGTTIQYYKNKKEMNTNVSPVKISAFERDLTDKFDEEDDI